jgi:hypothetical protein
MSFHLLSQRVVTTVTTQKVIMVQFAATNIVNWYRVANTDTTLSNCYISSFGGLVVSMLASGTQVRGFKPDLSRRIFQAKKSSACLPSEGK